MYNATESTAISLLGSIGVLFWILTIGIAVLCVVINWKFYEKSGQEGWKSIIPIYNIVVLYQIGGLPGWYVALTFIPCIGSILSIIFGIMCYINIAKSFGKSGAFAVGLIFLTPIFLGILAFNQNEKYNSVLIKEN